MRYDGARLVWTAYRLAIMIIAESQPVLKVCVYYCSTYYKAVRVWGGGGNNGGHVLRETTSRSLCG
jgi:hypothetical protein